MSNDSLPFTFISIEHAIRRRESTSELINPPALMVYDWFICLSREADLVWKKKIQLSAVLYFILRYLTIIHVSGTILLHDITLGYFSLVLPPTKFLYINALNSAVMSYGRPSAIMDFSVILIMRTYALCNQRMFVFALLVPLSIATTVLQSSKFDQSSFSQSSMPVNHIGWIVIKYGVEASVVFVFELLVFISSMLFMVTQNIMSPFTSAVAFRAVPLPLASIILLHFLLGLRQINMAKSIGTQLTEVCTEATQQLSLENMAYDGRFNHYRDLEISTPFNLSFVTQDSTS
ncbi:hypothetical protein BU17DRAFT_67132 [Hysterangium stoloniferum]|nr:hypothetical protein BU17DRAFT_67132 [Hysterangium stoloniferum]